MNPEHISQTLVYFFEPGDVLEIFLIGPKKRKSPIWDNEYAGGKKPIVAGWFDDIVKATDIIIKADKVEPVAIYCTLNPVTKALLVPGLLLSTTFVHTLFKFRSLGRRTQSKAGNVWRPIVRVGKY